MSITVTRNQAIGYVSVIAVLVVGIIYSFSRKPQIEIKTEVKTVEKIVYLTQKEDKNIHTKRVTVIAKDGTKTITSTIDDTSKIKDTSSTNIHTVDTKIDVKKYQTNWLLNASYPVTISNITTFDPTQVQMQLGRRIFDLPLFIDVGTTAKFNGVSVGITLEL